VDRHEQIAQVVQREYGNIDIAADDRHLRKAVGVATLRIRGNPHDVVVQGLLIGSEVGVGVKLVDSIAVIYTDTGRARKRSVAKRKKTTPRRSLAGSHRSVALSGPSGLHRQR